MDSRRRSHRRQGLGVFHSDDALKWTRHANNILRDPGKRPDDGVKGGHADVLVQGDNAWVFYFTHPSRVPAARDVDAYATRRTSIQVAKLELEGAEIICRRDEPFPFRRQLVPLVSLCCGAGNPACRDGAARHLRG